MRQNSQLERFHPLLIIPTLNLQSIRRFPRRQLAHIHRAHVPLALSRALNVDLLHTTSRRAQQLLQVNHVIATQHWIFEVHRPNRIERNGHHLPRAFEQGHGEMEDIVRVRLVADAGNQTAFAL